MYELIWVDYFRQFIKNDFYQLILILFNPYRFVLKLLTFYPYKKDK